MSSAAGSGVPAGRVAVPLVALGARSLEGLLAAPAPPEVRKGPEARLHGDGGAAPVSPATPRDQTRGWWLPGDLKAQWSLPEADGVWLARA